MHPGINQDIAKAYLADLYREADENRLAALAKASQPRQTVTERLRRAIAGLRTIPRRTAAEHA